MEDNKEPLNKPKEANIVLIYYLNDNKEEIGKLKFKYDKDFKIISYKDITLSFCQFLSDKQKKEGEHSILQNLFINKNYISYQYIEYFDGMNRNRLKKGDNIVLDEKISLDINYV